MVGKLVWVAKLYSYSAPADKMVQFLMPSFLAIQHSSPNLQISFLQLCLNHRRLIS